MQLVSEFLYRVSKWLTTLFFAIILCSILLEVFARNFFDHSFSWSGELAQYSFVWMTFIGASAVYKRNELVGLDFLMNYLPKKSQKILGSIIQTILLLFAITLVYYGFEKAFSNSVMVQYSTGLRVPMLVPYISIPIGMTMLLVHIIASFFKKSETNGEVY
jgi:TRAP-type C4-dicarboxylate transport system permease small subunit